MPQPTVDPKALQDTDQLEASLSQVEIHLGALGDALKQQDAAATEAAASQLHRALSTAMDSFTHAARRGAVPPALRRRLAVTGGQVAAQREAVARATSALDRAIDILIPDMAAARPLPMYSAQGLSLRAHSGGLAQA
ncbi:MAG: hypothetical protein C4K60_04655 [Ideonella sp. MAG2]|nr:MAG: hypothetical protein C4K60_04655 [Ideonella sp. MAG2]